MDTERSPETRGSSSEGFISVNSNRTPDTSADIKDGSYNNDPYGIKNIPQLLKSLEENFTFTAVLLGLIGYIVISSFGHMDSLAKYLGYIAFLSFIFLVYKFLGKNKIEVDFKNINNFLLFGFIIFLVLFLYEHNILGTIFNYIISLFFKR